MKIAIIHDDLVQFGGAEKVLLAFHEIWPKAPVYTLIASKKWKKVCKDLDIDLRVSFMDKLPWAEKLNRYFAPFLLHLFAMESFDLSDFGVVFSSSSRYAHGVITNANTKHICYMNSPGRMFWEPDNYFEEEAYGILKPIRALAKPFLSVPLSHIRHWDYISSQRVDKFIANATTPRKRIASYYRRDAKIIYPFVEYEKFSKGVPKKGNYFLALGRLPSWKRVDLAVQACTKLGLPLKVAGDGPDIDRLRKMAGETIEFLGHVTEEEKPGLLLGCIALIHTQREDFGIVPLEAMASGKPVIAYGAGGALETVKSGETGEFFYEQTSESLEELLKIFDQDTYDPYKCRKQARKFEKSRFLAFVKAFVCENALQ